MVEMYQVTWFSKKKGYGFVSDSEGVQYFVHHSDVKSEGYRYLVAGELVTGEKKEMSEGRVKLSEIRSPMRNGKLRCSMLGVGRVESGTD